MPNQETPRQRSWRLAREAAKRMSKKPCRRTALTCLKHMKEALK